MNAGSGNLLSPPRLQVVHLIRSHVGKAIVSRAKLSEWSNKLLLLVEPVSTWWGWH